MSLCFVCPRFYPVIGGTETYLYNIAKYCSSNLNTTVITSNLINFPTNLFGKYTFINKKYDLLNKKLKIIRVNTLNNFILRSLFFFNQYLNKNIEIYLDKRINPSLYIPNKSKKINQKLENFLVKNLIYQRFCFAPNFSKIYYFLKKIHKSQKIDLVHSSPIRFTADISAFLFCKKNHVPYICTPLYHINPYADSIFYPSFQYILKNAEAVIAVTDIEKKFYTKYGINNKKIHIISPGIEPTDYKKPDTKNFKEMNNIPENAPVLFFMGRRNFEKGIITTILSLHYLIKEFKDIKLLVAGPKTFDYLKFIKKIPSKLNSHIIDLGIVDMNTKTDALANCDVFILPSIDDAFGIVYLEAWLFKKPVIGALGGNVEGLIDDEQNGFLVPFNNIKKLASKVEVLLKNEKLREQIGHNGFNKLKNNYTLEITNKKILDLYKKFIK